MYVVSMYVYIVKMNSINSLITQIILLWNLNHYDNKIICWTNFIIFY